MQGVPPWLSPASAARTRHLLVEGGLRYACSSALAVSQSS